MQIPDPPADIPPALLQQFHEAAGNNAKKLPGSFCPLYIQAGSNQVPTLRFDWLKRFLLNDEMLLGFNKQCS